MNHEQAENLLPAYLDNELSLSEAADFERHLNSCAQCQQTYQEQGQISGLIKNNVTYFKAKPELDKRIQMSLVIDASKSAPQQSTNKFWQFNWLMWGSKGSVMASLAALLR